MHLAVAKLDVKSVVKLIMKKAEINVADLNTGDHPIHLLMNVFTKNTIASKKILSFLHEAGVDINCTNKDLWTPLHLAVKKGCYEGIEELLSLNSHLDLDRQGGLL